jgi:hypothetical protein
MKPEYLERLLIDRELGELAPEVMVLLEEYLELSPEVREQADTTRNLLQLARAATAGPREVPQVKLGLERLRHAQQSAWWRARAAEWVRLAAAVAIGLSLGWLVRPRLPVSIALAAPAEVVAAPKTSTSFWSIEAYLQNSQPRTSGPARYRLQWDSPVKMPRVEENS